MKRIGVLTGGGDAPGLNPAIRAVVYRAADFELEVLGIHDGWAGLLAEGDRGTSPLSPEQVRTWDRAGGTALGSSRTNPFRCQDAGGQRDRSPEVIDNLERLGLDGLVAIGGEDTLGVAAGLAALGVPVIGIPKTIDRDLSQTDYTLGFDTAVRTVAAALERARTPAGSHRWVQVVEVMGRHAGHLALWSGLAGDADLILIPELPFEITRVCGLLADRVADRRNGLLRSEPGYAMVVCAEGAYSLDRGEIVVDDRRDAFGHARLGGVGAWLADQIRDNTRLDARAVALGHPQRGGAPSPIDRAMGWLFGVAAVEALHRGHTGMMVSARGIAPAVDLRLVRIADAVSELSVVDVARHYDPNRYHMRRSVLPGAPATTADPPTAGVSS